MCVTVHPHGAPTRCTHTVRPCAPRPPDNSLRCWQCSAPLRSSSARPTYSSLCTGPVLEKGREGDRSTDSRVQLRQSTGRQAADSGSTECRRSGGISRRQSTAPSESGRSGSRPHARGAPCAANAGQRGSRQHFFWPRHWSTSITVLYCPVCCIRLSTYVQSISECPRLGRWFRLRPESEETQQVW